MKHIIAIFSIVLFFIPVLRSETTSIVYNNKDLERLKEAAKLFDNHEVEAALNIFDSLLTIYPEDYAIRYERGLALFELKKYNEVVKEMEDISKDNSAEPIVYQLWGKSLAQLGQLNDARMVYLDGLKRFPNAGILFFEIGNIYANHNNPDRALTFYNAGIEMDPNFAYNYYKGALNYFDSDSEAWGLIYAESEILLNPNEENSKNVMAKGILDCYSKCITMKDSLVDVSMAPSDDLIARKDKETDFYFRAPTLIEFCYAAGTGVYFNQDYNPKHFTSIVELRRKMVDFYFRCANNYFGDGLYLLAFQKKVIDAGHWDAYNYFLFSDVLLYECEMWKAEHPDAYHNFIEWYNNGNKFNLDKDKTVGIRTVYNHVKPMDEIKAVKTLNNIIRSLQEYDRDK